MTAKKTEHSPLGASSAARWLNCEGSPALIKTLPKEPDTDDSRRGTEAHALAAYCLLNDDVASSFIGLDFEGEFIEPITEETARAVDEYLTEVRKVSTLKNARLYVEDRLVLEEVDPMLWGTADAIVFVPAYDVICNETGEIYRSVPTLYVFDYKNGVGVTVPAEDNPQLQYYAYGAWISFRHVGPEKIDTTIVQPNAPGRTVKSATLSPIDLYDFSLDLEEGVARTRSPDAQLRPGPWCANTFCPARGVCPALFENVTAACTGIDGEIIEPSRMDADELGARLHKSELFMTWYNALWAEAERRAAQGKYPTGFKHVQGRGRRVWDGEKTEDEIAKAIRNVGNSVDPWTKKLITAPAAEKALGKKTFKQIEHLVTTKPGGVSLVPVSDPRPAYTGDNGDGFEAIDIKG